MREVPQVPQMCFRVPLPQLSIHCHPLPSTGPPTIMLADCSLCFSLCCCPSSGPAVLPRVRLSVQCLDTLIGLVAP